MHSFLIDDLTSRFDRAVPIALLIDPMLGEPLIDLRQSGLDGVAELTDARNVCWRRDTCIVELDPRTALKTAQMPYLVELSGIDDLWLAKSIRHAEVELERAQSGFIGEPARAAHRWGQWLQTSMHLPALAQHCAELMRVRVRTAVKERYLRLADRRVMDLWLWQIGEETAAQALGATISWHYMDAAARIRSLRGAAAMQSCKAPILDAAQWQAMTHGAAIHGIIATWFGQLRNEGAVAPSMSEAFERALDALGSVASARRRWPTRFQSTADDQSWAVLTLLFPKIENDLDVERSLANAGPNDEPVTALHELADQLAEPLRAKWANAQDASTNASELSTQS